MIFLSGMPRSGSTLLMNILGQNPNFYVTPTSGLCNTLINVRNTWDETIEHLAYVGDMSKIKRKNTLQAIIENYHKDVGEKVVIDKSRGWLAYIELLTWLLGEDVKILISVRDMRDILTSWELLWRKGAMHTQLPQERGNFLQMQTLADRLKFYVSGTQPIGLAFNRIQDAVTRGHRDKLHFVSYEEMTNNPKETFIKIYKFLGLGNFTHDFNNIKQITHENDSVYGIEGLHTIKNKLEPSVPKWFILGDLANNYYVDWSKL